MDVIKLNRDGPGINQSETKTVMAQRLTNRLSKPTRIKQTITKVRRHPPDILGANFCENQPINLEKIAKKLWMWSN